MFTCSHCASSPDPELSQGGPSQVPSTNGAQTEGQHSEPQGRSHLQVCVTCLCQMMNTKTKTFSQQEVFYRTCVVIAVTGLSTPRAWEGSPRLAGRAAARALLQGQAQG